jgi:hypothetical protein
MTVRRLSALSHAIRSAIGRVTTALLAAMLGGALILPVAGIGGVAAAVDLKVVTVTVQPLPYTPLGSGVMSSGDGYFDCVVTLGVVSGSCSHSYLVVSSVSITWTLTPSSDSEICMDFCFAAVSTFDQDYSASTTITTWGFKAGPTYRAVTVVRSGPGHGTVTSSPGGITCGSTCTANFANGSQVSLTATASAGSIFVGWDNEGPCSIAGSTCTFAADAVTVYATFILAPPTSPPQSAPATSPPSPSPAPHGSPGATALPTGSGATAQPSSATRPTGGPRQSLETSGGSSPASGGTADPSGNPSPGATSDTTPVLSTGTDGGPDVLALAILAAGLFIAIGLSLGLRRRPASANGERKPVR